MCEGLPNPVPTLRSSPAPAHTLHPLPSTYLVALERGSQGGGLGAFWPSLPWALVVCSLRGGEPATGNRPLAHPHCAQPVLAHPLGAYLRGRPSRGLQAPFVSSLNPFPSISKRETEAKSCGWFGQRGLLGEPEAGQLTLPPQAGMRHISGARAPPPGILPLRVMQGPRHCAKYLTFILAAFRGGSG